MKKRLVWIMVITILTVIFMISSFYKRIRAQAESETSSRGLFGDILDAVKLHNLVENMYYFRKRIASEEGPDSELFNWLLPGYRSFSNAILRSPFWILKLLFLPAAIVISSLLPFYSQIGLIGIAFSSGLLTGMFYALPLFLLIEIFSKTGLVAIHGKTMLKLLLILFIVSAFLLLVAYGYPNAPLLFSSYLILIFTLWFTWFLPIVLYYNS
ncbi:MAG: hypothetical protein NZ873_01895 [Crenarchaeota archaeon]|nr:hypothetical protein [Thermoproteota archaeon]MDW8034261.1 hypothetical protein [Nitrososphaerota archaeon]